jgi:hypothetical protein
LIWAACFAATALIAMPFGGLLQLVLIHWRMLPGDEFFEANWMTGILLIAALPVACVFGFIGLLHLPRTKWQVAIALVLGLPPLVLLGFVQAHFAQCYLRL